MPCQAGRQMIFVCSLAASNKTPESRVYQKLGLRKGR
jgi:hypothetical protein